MTALRLPLLVAALLAAAAITAGAARGQDCPTTVFLSFDGLVYAAEPVPGSISLPYGDQLGPGIVDAPVSEDGCKREREDSTVARAGAVDPGVAVRVEGWGGSLFVLGARCAGYEGEARWDCLLKPLSFRGQSYAGARYESPPADGRLEPAGTLGEATLAGDPVAVTAIAGVEATVAVTVDGRPGEVFVAAGACPYERPSAEAADDDLARCLRAPLWLVFDPLGATTGSTVAVRADRAAPSELAGAEVSLVRLDGAADIVPDDLDGAIPIGRLDPDGQPSPDFVIPDLPAGLYEALVTCERCEESLGAAVFPAGSLLVFAVEETSEGSSGMKWIAGGIGVGFFFLLVASAVLWRKGWGRRARPPA